MMPDIFSSFDPYMFKSFIPLTSSLLIINLLFLGLISLFLWPSSSRQFSPLSLLTEIILSQLLRTKSKSLKGASTIISSIFPMIIIINLLGMIPYFFSLSSHLIMTLTLGLPLWAGLIMSSLLSNPKSSLAHFLPDGAPTWLNPFLVLIETTSTLVRPITLSFRLAANMTAGHIVLTLIGTYCVSATLTSLSSTILLTTLTSAYILFELGICFIQAYIFCLLLSLYADEHA